MIRSIYFWLATISILLIVACSSENNQPTGSAVKPNPRTPSAYSLAGKPLYAPEPSEELLAKFEQHKTALDADHDNADALIWYGRFAAYKGDYREAIAAFSNGIQAHPHDSRMLRHRGHRFISMRKFDRAIADLKRAAELIEGTENEIEPDGMPNEKNIPVSTLHGNIWYHLGLAYYLNHDFENALRAYKNCLDVSTNPDNVVSSTHWLYMINRRLGDIEAATACLERIEPEMDVIENMNYHKCCLFYKGLISLEELQGDSETGPAGDSIQYAIGNWLFYNGEVEKARSRFEKLTNNGGWNSFGFIAAESDLAKENYGGEK